MPLTYRLDVESRVVRIRVDQNLLPSDLIAFYEGILGDERFQPGYRFLVDRRDLQTPPTAMAIRTMMAYLQTRADRLGDSRMAVVLSPGTPEAPWRNAELLAGYYTPLKLHLFDDYGLAESWLTQP